jgi:hypothetical protein
MLACNLFALILCRVIVLDSSFLTLDVANTHITEVELGEQIIDHVYDDHLFVSTAKNLYKIALSGTVLIDKTPLPMRFNHLMLKDDEIILIATDEVIVLDRNNLAFRSGVGLERGDHRPIVKNQSFAILPTKDYIYLASDAGEQSFIRIIDLHSGRLVRKVRTDRVKSFDYDAKSRSFIALDVKNNILTFDLYMNRKHKIQPQVTARAVAMHPDGFLVRCDQGILLITAGGAVIDFQPIPYTLNQAGFLVLSQEAIIGFDNTALRPNGWLMNQQNIVQIYPCANSDYDLAVDPQDNIYLVRQEPLHITPLARNKVQLRRVATSRVVSDSCWYLQLAAFSDPVNAQHAYEELLRKGLPAFIDSADLYRIKFGGFPDKFTGIQIAEKMDLSGWFVYEHRSVRKQFGAFSAGTERYIIQEGIIKKEQ